ncbi:MAG TPA: ABC transporter permease, partial [bacterium]|nr:ABC transporter permease [bacterium]
RRLAVTPIKRHHVVISQVLFRLIFGVIQSTILLLFGWLLYRVPVHGNLIILLSVICVSVVMFLSMGYIIASLAKNEESVEPIVQVFAMPMMFLSGVFFPIELMPEFIRPFVRALPLTYLNDALRAVINQAEGFAAIGTDLLVMGIWLVGSLAVAVKIFKWE